MHLQRNPLGRNEKDRLILLFSLLAVLDILSNCGCCKNLCCNKTPMMLLWTCLMYHELPSSTLFQCVSMCTVLLCCQLMVVRVILIHFVIQCIKYFGRFQIGILEDSMILQNGLWFPTKLETVDVRWFVFKNPRESLLICSSWGSFVQGILITLLLYLLLVSQVASSQSGTVLFLLVMKFFVISLLCQ
jgi:hypothetical protein